MKLTVREFDIFRDEDAGMLDGLIGIEARELIVFLVQTKSKSTPSIPSRQDVSSHQRLNRT